MTSFCIPVKVTSKRVKMIQGYSRYLLRREPHACFVIPRGFSVEKDVFTGSFKIVCRKVICKYKKEF